MRNANLSHNILRIILGHRTSISIRFGCAKSDPKPNNSLFIWFHQNDVRIHISLISFAQYFIICSVLHFMRSFADSEVNWKTFHTANKLNSFEMQHEMKFFYFWLIHWPVRSTRTIFTTFSECFTISTENTVANAHRMQLILAYSGWFID